MASEGHAASAAKGLWLNCSRPFPLSIISVGLHVTCCGVSFIRDDNDEVERDKTQG